MPADVSRHKLRHREGSEIAPKYACVFLRAFARNDVEAIHAAAGAQDCFPLARFRLRPKFASRRHAD
jgi:hypothetical protein